MEILQVVVGIDPSLHPRGKITDDSLAATIPDGWQIHPQARVEHRPLKPGGVEQQICGIKTYFGISPIFFDQLGPELSQILQILVGQGRLCSVELGTHDILDLAGRLLVGKTKQGLTLLQAEISEFAE